jgi:hypothetical protein
MVAAGLTDAATSVTLSAGDSQVADASDLKPGHPVRPGQQAPGKEVIRISFDSQIGAGMVAVRQYLRLRLGRWETVRAHYRRWPMR